MDWQQALELEMEVAVADALQDGPADQAAVARVRRNLRDVLERWLSQGRIPPPITGYHLDVQGGKGVEVRLEWEEARRPDTVVVTSSPIGD